MELKNKVAVITGASRGIGKEIALSLAAEDVRVALIGRTQSDLETISESILQKEASGYAVDISNEKAVEETILEILNEFGQIDFLINNAGVGSFNEFEKFSENEWDRIMDTNVKGTFLMTKHVIPSMKKKKSGHILTIASDVSKRTFANGSVYCASKYAQDALISTLRKEVRPFGVKVSLIYPGMVDTYFGDSKMGEDHKQMWLKVQDIAQAAVYVLNTPKHMVVDELMIHPMCQEY